MKLVGVRQVACRVGVLYATFVCDLVLSAIFVKPEFVG